MACALPSDKRKHVTFSGQIMTLTSRKRGILALAGGVLALALAGCQTVDDLAPQAGVRNTGAYPDLNVAQKGETQQLSGTETDQKVAELKAAQAAAAARGGGGPSTSQAELRRATKKQQQTLKEIEGE